MEKYDLYLRPEKCEFEKSEIEYLGLLISEGKLRMDPGKVAAVKDWPTPKNLKEVRGFIGFANFYRRFIKDFAKLARPLHDLTKKEVPFQWGPNQQQAFDNLKTAFTTAPILRLWNPELPTKLEVDASGFATGGVILQQQEDQLWRPVAFRSSSMNDAERNYEIYDREMLAVILALKDWRHFLEGAHNPFTIVTDHSNLQFWRTAQNLSRRQACWALDLSPFDFRMVHQSGKTNSQADALSRLPQHQVSDADDNQQKIVLPPSVFMKLAATYFFSNPLEE